MHVTRRKRGAPPATAPHLVQAVVKAVLRRRGVLFAVPLLYLSAILVLAGKWSLDGASPAVVVGVTAAFRRRHVPAPGSVYKSSQVFEKLWPMMEADSNHTNALKTAWHKKSGQTWKPCTNKRLTNTGIPFTGLLPSNGYLIIEANGGLNQQRLSICDAVAVAGLLNATLVIPMFHLNSVWRDSSKFGDIFDEDYFIESLKNHVRVVKGLPEDLLEKFDHNISSITNMRTKAFSSKSYYLQKVLPKLLELGAVRIAPFSNRLAQTVPPRMQRLRCLANFEALRFSEPIRLLAQKMVDRMVMKSHSLSDGKYVSVHLRFEEDMVAFSCCKYDGGIEEEAEMERVRERGWRGKFHRHGRVISPEANRRDGRCPLTPLEVGMMLRGMGFGNKTLLYVASGKIYNAKKYMAPLRQLFPLLETKETLASADELAPFKGHSSRLAALDYTICAHGEVFVTTQGGNFPHFLMGHRIYMYDGHAKTIKPDKRKMVLYLDNPHIRWDRFKRQMQDMLRNSDAKGYGLRKPNDSLYNFPMPDCMCPQPDG
ncbi:O-fucosyltransferase 9-like isoform X2 [Carex rostrata]